MLSDVIWRFKTLAVPKPGSKYYRAPLVPAVLLPEAQTPLKVALPAVSVDGIFE